MKRVLVAIFFGLVAGGICAAGGILGGIMKPTALARAWGFLNRGLMGFVIAISGLRLHWAWNGILLGMAVGSIFSYSLFLQTHAVLLPVINFFVNGLFGLMIEFFTTVVFRQAAASRIHVAEPAAVLKA